MLGNGICRAFGGFNWNGLLDNIKESTLYPEKAENYIMPMPLKAAMLTNNNIASKIRELVKEAKAKKLTTGESSINWESFTTTTPKMRLMINQMVDKRFDYVLTTNYSYEIEMALLGVNSITPKTIQEHIQHYEVDNPQIKYLINTYCLVNGTPVWHIHGEARIPDTMVLSHQYYGKVLQQTIDRLEGISVQNAYRKISSKGKTDEFRRNKKQLKQQKIGSWIDAFVLGDLYIVGLGLDVSEVDLWWLLDYKRNNPDICGKTVFYDPENDIKGKCLYDNVITCEKTTMYKNTNQCKDLLLQNAYGVEKRSLSIVAHNNSDYQQFYEKVLENLKTI